MSHHSPPTVHASLHSQPNALAALAACIEVSDAYCTEALEANAVVKLLSLLSSVSAPSPPTTDAPPPIADAKTEQIHRQICLNTLTALGTIAETSPTQGLESIVASDGINAITSACTEYCEHSKSVETISADTLLLQEAGADALCKILSNGGPEVKQAAEKATIIPLFADMVITHHDVRSSEKMTNSGKESASEVTVRALMGTAMMLGSGNESMQLQFISHPGAVHALLKLMRNEEDADCQQIAAALFSALAQSSPPVKTALTEAMRATS